MSSLPSLFDIFFVIVLIIPGFLAWQWARFVCNEVERERRMLGEREKFSSFDITVYSLCFTLPIVAIFSFVTGIQSIDALRDNIFDPINLLILVILAIFCGTVFGGGIIAYDKYSKPKNGKQKYHVEEANNLSEAKQLIKKGYEYAADFNDAKLFKIRSGSKNDEEKYLVEEASNLSETKQLIENGFEYVTEMDGIKLFRKRK